MSDFHEVNFPLRLALGSSGGPIRKTDIVNLSNGGEKRNQRWRNSRRHYDVGGSIRSKADLYEVLAFFEARRGQLYGFRFKDPIDFQSGHPDQAISGLDELIGTGDGEQRDYQLIKHYGDGVGAYERKITKPITDSLRVTIEGELCDPSDYEVDHTTGVVTFAADAVPRSGDAIMAGFGFDVPVRFDVDQVDINFSAFNAGSIPNISLVEILP